MSDILRFMDRVESRTGVVPVAYLENSTHLKRLLSSADPATKAKLRRMPYWLALYSPNTGAGSPGVLVDQYRVWSDWTLWQYGGVDWERGRSRTKVYSHGAHRFPLYFGNIDRPLERNVFNGSGSELRVFWKRHGLKLNDVEYFPDLHGGTLRWHVARHRDRSLRCQGQLDAERDAGMTAIGYYADFADRVETCQRELRALVDAMRSDGRRVAAYGAAAKGATLLNSSGLGRGQIDYVVDRNVHKQGKLMPGCRLPIRPVEVLTEDQPDFVVLLAWNFADEIVAQQAAYVAAGGSFYVPVPHPRRVAG
jgi:hypothetical protein